MSTTRRSALTEVRGGPNSRRPVASTTALPYDAAQRVDTVRALCHDLRQPLAAIRLLAGSHGGDAQHRLDIILQEAQWLTDMVEAVIGGAADDWLKRVDVVDLALHCVVRARPTAQCSIALMGVDRAMAVAAPIALGRAIGCLLDNAVRAAGPGGHVIVEISTTHHRVTILVTDDGPGMGHVPINNSLGLTITRALVSSCGGSFTLGAGCTGGVVARIALPTIPRRITRPAPSPSS